VRLKSSGLVVVYNIIPEVIAEVEAKAQVTVAKVAHDIAEDAKSRAPVRTGYLRDSIVVDGEGKAGFVTAGAEYAGFVEYGTYKMAARPFMTPAVEAHKDEFFDGKNYFPRGSI
jgi:HK97 gp10 family phage protein